MCSFQVFPLNYSNLVNYIESSDQFDNERTKRLRSDGLQQKIWFLYKARVFD